MNTILKNIWRPLFNRSPRLSPAESLAAAQLRNVSFDYKGALRLLKKYPPDNAAAAKALEQAIRDNQKSYIFVQACRNQRIRPLKNQNFAGTWSAKITQKTLIIRGVANTESRLAGIYIDDNLIKIINWKTEVLGEGLKLRSFTFKIRAPLLQALPSGFQLSVGTEAGPLASTMGKFHIPFKNPSGKGEGWLKLKKHHFVNKKGEMTKLKSHDKKWQEEVMARYAELSSYFEKTFGYSLFIIYGTLLGQQRDGKFIPHDDDFDTAYLSRYTTPEEVKEEMKQIIARMAADGYKLHIAKSRATFKYPVKNGPIDFFPAWIAGGRLWMWNTTSIEADASLFLPVCRTHFKNMPVNIPNKTRDFLIKKYGRKWRTPDTGYYPVAAPGTHEYLLRACMTESETESLIDEINAREQGQVSALA